MLFSFSAANILRVTPRCPPGLPRGAPELGGERGFLVQRHLLEAGAPPASVSRGAQALAQPLLHAARVCPRAFHSEMLGTRQCQGQQSTVRRLKTPRFGNVIVLDLREGMAAHTENTG